MIVELTQPEGELAEDGEAATQLMKCGERLGLMKNMAKVLQKWAMSADNKIDIAATKRDYCKAVSELVYNDEFCKRIKPYLTPPPAMKAHSPLRKPAAIVKEKKKGKK